MIHFEITEGPDLNTTAPFLFYQNQIYLGRTSGDLWIKDHDLSASHVMLEVIGHELLIHPQKGVEFYLINGKRATTIRKIKVNDVIQIGATKIKVLSFEETIRESKKTLLNQKLQKLIEANASRLVIVESLTKKMK